MSFEACEPILQTSPSCTIVRCTGMPPSRSTASEMRGTATVSMSWRTVWMLLPVGRSAWMSGSVGLGDTPMLGVACVPGSAGGGGMLAGDVVGPRLPGIKGGGGTEGGNGACGLRGAIPETPLPACGIWGAIGATGAEGVWGRAGIFGWAIRSLKKAVRLGAQETNPFQG
jgi:hypothetical protein